MEEIRVLYVEDDDFTRESMGKMLKRDFSNVYLAENGLSGVEIFKQTMPDVVVTDIQMPLMNGIEMINAIKSINPEMPIIVTTAYNDETFKTEKSSAVLIKPLSRLDIVNMIKQYALKKHY